MKKRKTNTTFLILILLGGMTFVWIVQAMMFSIFSYSTTIYFALDKIPGHFFSLQIQLTLFCFLVLLLMYGILVFLLTTNEYDFKSTIIFLSLAIISISMAAVLTYPVGALDLFNYVLIGKLVVFYRQNPFLVPFTAVGALDPLSKYAIFLNVTTGYGPLWVLLTSFIMLLSGTSALLPMILTYKGMTVFFFLATGVLLYQIPTVKQEKILVMVSYVCNPFIIFEGIVNAHNDILVSFFIVLAWWSYKRKHMTLFLWLMLAGLIKLYAFVLLPLFFITVLKEKWEKKEIIVSVLIGLGSALLLYLPFWANGKVLSGVFEGLHNAQVINGYSPYSLLREYLGTSSPILQYIFLGIFLMVFLYVLMFMMKTKEYSKSCNGILLLFFLAVTIYQPWYVIPALACLVLSGKKRDLTFSFVISSGALLSYPFSVWAWFHSGWSTFSIHLFLASFIALPSFLYVLLFLKDIRAFHSTTQD